MSFEDYWPSTLRPGTPSELVEHGRSFAFSGVQPGAVIVHALTPYIDLSLATAPDLGCGYGEACIAFAQCGTTIPGVDLNEVRLQGARIWARGQLPDLSISFEHASAEAVSFSAGSFDLVIRADVLEHVQNQSLVM